jgi:hypothetical protein
MPLARAWWRGSAWALAATLVVPGALAIVVATIALGGGLRSLGAVAQIVTGPEVPEARLGGQPAARPSGSARPTPLPSVPSAGGAAATTRAYRAPAPAGTRAPSSSNPSPAPSTGPARPVAKRPATTAPAPTVTPQGPGNNPPPSDAIRQTGKAVAGTVGSTVPAPAGPAAADAVTTVLDLVDPGPRAAAAAPAP